MSRKPYTREAWERQKKRKALARIARHLSGAARAIAELEVFCPPLFDRVTDELAPLFVMRELECGVDIVHDIMSAFEAEKRH